MAKELYSVLSKKKKELENNIPTLIYQKDFLEGTYIIDKPGHYKLAENIVFSPNPDNDYLPKMSNPKYQSLGYVLGFFTAIAIYADGVYLNLNGFTISASMQFIIQQRFFSLIELADRPFDKLTNSNNVKSSAKAEPVSEGPANFGTPLQSAKNVIIENGILDQNSHHCIHGNMASNVLISKIQMRNFEFVGIALNGGNNVILKDLKIGPTRPNIQVLATYSAGRFCKMFANHILSKNLLNDNDKATLLSKLSILQNEMDTTFNEIMSGQEVSSHLFRNPSKLPDGNCYGVLVKDQGFAIQDFVNKAQVISERKTKTSNIFLYNVDIQGINCKVDEVVALSTKGGIGASMDVAGSVFQIDEVTFDGKYHGNSLSEMKLCLAKIAIDYRIPLGKNNISIDIINWAKNGQDISVLLNNGYKYKLNSDSMFHNNKGFSAYRFDALDNLKIKKCSISNCSNSGYLGNDKLLGAYEKGNDMAKRNGYYGCDVVGINLSYCSNVKISKTKIKNIKSSNGRTYGIRGIFESQFEVEKCAIEGLDSGNKKCIDYYGNPVKYSDITKPNFIPKSTGIYIEIGSSGNIKNTEISDLKSVGKTIKIYK